MEYTLHVGENFSRQYLEIFLLIFPESKIWHFMQIVSLVAGR